MVSKNRRGVSNGAAEEGVSMSVEHETPLEVFRPGSRVKMLLGDDGWETAMVQAVRVQLGGVVDYNLIYWKDGERKTAWVEQFEVKAMSESDGRTTIGFLSDER